MSTDTCDWFETRMACPPMAAAETGAVDWHDMHLNGMPAVHRAIARLQKAQERAEAAHRAEICELRARVAELEYLWSEEIMRQLLPGEVREVVAELGHGWRIEREANDISKHEEQEHATK
jgi:hypothetical protein